MVYVLNKDGQPLMPTKRHGKVRRMLNDGRAKVIRRTPFTIQLLYDGPSYVQDVALGMDAGYAHVGTCASTPKEVLYSSQAELRTDIVGLLKERRELRRGRRNRKTRYRKPRFLNRTNGKKKGWRAPSIEQKVDSHIRLIKRIQEILPVSNVRIETAEFDIHKIKTPSYQGRATSMGRSMAITTRGITCSGGTATDAVAAERHRDTFMSFPLTGEPQKPRKTSIQSAGTASGTT